MHENQMSNITNKQAIQIFTRLEMHYMQYIYNIGKIRHLASSATRIEALKLVMMMLVLTHTKIYIYIHWEDEIMLHIFDEVGVANTVYKRGGGGKKNFFCFTEIWTSGRGPECRGCWPSDHEFTRETGSQFVAGNLVLLISGLPVQSASFSAVLFRITH